MFWNGQTRRDEDGKRTFRTVLEQRKKVLNRQFYWKQYYKLQIIFLQFILYAIYTEITLFRLRERLLSDKGHHHTVLKGAASKSFNRTIHIKSHYDLTDICETLLDCKKTTERSLANQKHSTCQSNILRAGFKGLKKCAERLRSLPAPLRSDSRSSQMAQEFLTATWSRV